MTARTIGLALAVALSGCDNGDPKTEKSPEPTPPKAGTETKARVTLETSHGTIVLELDPAKGRALLSKSTPAIDRRALAAERAGIYTAGDRD